MARACHAPCSSGSARISRLVLLLLAWCLIGAAPAPVPLGASFHRLDKGRVTRSALPPGTRRIAIYYGASWCGPCRAFVPELVAAYPRLRARGIEILFVGDDASCAARLDYARTSRMPWLLLTCDPRQHARLRALAGRALPGIVVLDAAGRRIGTSWAPDGDSTPRRTLRELLGGSG